MSDIGKLLATSLALLETIRRKGYQKREGDLTLEELRLREEIDKFLAHANEVLNA